VTRRNLTPAILEALSDTPVVLLHGGRQTGKSTLAQWLAAAGHLSRYLTLDDAGALAAARNDPAGFIASLEGSVVIDEVQRAPELFLAIKAEVDRNRRPGRFLLTGSANVMTLPRLADSLAGRIEILTLWPMAQAELTGAPPEANFPDAVFGRTLPVFAGRGRGKAALLDLALAGGFPAALSRSDPARRRAWFGAYVTTILQRDVRDLGNVEALAALPRLLALLATRAASLLNLADVSRAMAMPHSTLARYVTLLHSTFLIDTLPAWSANVGKRLAKAYKLLLCDTGLNGYLLGLDRARLADDPGLAGPLLENFVALELLKQAGWSRTRPSFCHLRSHSGDEVDLVLEDRAGNLVGIEVKSGATLSAADFKGLRSLAAMVGRRFRRGVVLYTGTEAVGFAPNLHALPVEALWSWGSKGA